MSSMNRKSNSNGRFLSQAKPSEPLEGFFNSAKNLSFSLSDSFVRSSSYSPSAKSGDVSPSSTNLLLMFRTSIGSSVRALALPPRSFNSLKRSSVRMESQSFSTESSAKPRGALIVVEGLDRSGKSTQCAKLRSFLESSGHPTELWRFPDRETSVGQMISAYLSNKSQLDDHTIHLLFSANRWEKRSLMEEKLKTGTTLIVDRYSYSGVAFSSAKGLGIEWCKAPEIGLLAPDTVLYLDISPERAAERGGYGDERYERVDFQRKVAGFYQTLRDSSWKVIDAGETMEEVEKKIQEVVLDKVKECAQGKSLSLLWSS